MTTDAIALAQKVKQQFEKFKAQRQFEELAQLIASSLQILPREYNQQIFGYIPQIFRQIELKDSVIQAKDICLGEPVIYKLYFPHHQRLYGFAYFYIFCYLKQNSSQLNVFFQSANPSYKKLTPDEYDLDQGKISFEASTSSFKSDQMSVISISDPGHFILGLTSSYYVGSEEINFNQIIAQVLKNICELASIKLQETMLFGSSAGTFGALLSSTYLQQKTNVLVVNSQVNLHHKAELMQTIFKQTNPKLLLEKFGNQISCTYRFKQDITGVPNIYILANINDNLHNRNFEFYKQYLLRFTQKGRNNQSIFDSYYGIEGHGRPEANSLRAKIKLAREILTMKSI
jgi:hypothetical protein